MKKTIFAGAIAIASMGVASAQGLYDLAPNDDAQESSPVKWYATANVGYDDNVTPTITSGPGHEQSAGYLSAYVGATFVSVTPQTTWDVYGQIGGIYYFDPIVTSNGTDTEDLFGEARLGFNITHRVSERLRLSSRNYVSYEMEPDYAYGMSSDRSLEQYLYYRTDNSIGYQWTERFGTYAGFAIYGADYQDSASVNDRTTWEAYLQLRYRATPQTVWTAGYRYGQTDRDVLGDSTSHYVTVGVEHRFSPNTVFAGNIGAQIRDTDNGSDGTSPYVDLALRSQVNEQFGYRLFARYGYEDWDTTQTVDGVGPVAYDTNETFRFGITGDYIVSPQLTLFAGANIIYTDYSDGLSIGGVAGPNTDVSLYNLNIGFAYAFNDAWSLTGSYNYTNSISDDISSRDYSRNRVQIGARVDF